MSLPPYKHTRNPCLQTEEEPLIPGLAGAPLITYRCVQEKRRTSDQRVARFQNMPGVEFEYEYVPVTYTRPESQINVESREKTILKPGNEDHRQYQQHRKIKSVDFECVNKQSPPGASGDQLRTVKDIGECATRIYTCNNVAGNLNLKDAKNDAKSTCSRRSSVSHRSLISHCSQKTESSGKSEKSEKRSVSRESLSSTLNAVLKTATRKEKKSEELCFQKFGKIANGLDDDDLRPRRR